MTSEVVVMNRLAVALAADSATTVSGPSSRKIWNSANKLFALSNCHPVGVMIYNGASILGVPWETIIKSYRSQLGNKSFDTLVEYGNDFLLYLNGNSLLFPRAIQNQYFLRGFSQMIDGYREEARRVYIREILANDQTADESKIFSNIVDDRLVLWLGFKDLHGMGDDIQEKILDSLGDQIDQQIDSLTKELNVDDLTKGKLRQLSIMFATKSEFGGDYTGIVFAGFGENEHFPVLQYFTVGGVVLDRLRCSEATVENVSDSCPSVVTPFAQSEMVDTFLEGINPQFSEDLVRNFIGLALELPNTVIDAVTDLDEAQKSTWKNRVIHHARDAIKEMLEKLQSYRYERHWAPVHAALIHLPKDELAHVAEALVNLNSFQKKVSMDDETVGGPIDVAVISKGDGLIWIKRKHYFSRELNEHYYNNLFKAHKE